MPPRCNRQIRPRRKATTYVATSVFTFAARCCCLYKIALALSDLWLVWSFCEEHGSLNYNLDEYIAQLQSQELPFQEKLLLVEERIIKRILVSDEFRPSMSQLEVLAIWRVFFWNHQIIHLQEDDEEGGSEYSFSDKALSNPLMHIAVLYSPPPGDESAADKILATAVHFAEGMPEEVRAYMEEFADDAMSRKTKLENCRLGYQKMKEELCFYDVFLSVHEVAFQFFAIAKLVYELAIFSLVLYGLWDPFSSRGKTLLLIPTLMGLATLTMWLCLNNLADHEFIDFNEVVIRSLSWDFYGRRPMETFTTLGMSQECLQLSDLSPDLHTDLSLGWSSSCLWLHTLLTCESVFLHLVVVYLCYQNGTYLVLTERFSAFTSFPAIPKIRLNAYHTFHETAIWFFQKAHQLLLNLKQSLKKREEPESVWFQASLEGKCETLKKLIKSGVIHDLNIKSEKHDGDTALMLACRNSHLSVVQLLLDQAKQRVNPNIGSPLIVSSRLGHALIVARLLKSNHLQMGQGTGEKAIAEAVANDNFKVAHLIGKRMHERNICFRNENLKTWIYRANILSKELRSQRLTAPERKVKQEQLKHFKDQILCVNAPKAAAPNAVLYHVQEHESNEKKAEEDMEDYTECKICFDPMVGSKIFACLNDHWLCESCSRKTTIGKCPFCSQDFSENPPRRCHQVENLLALLAKK